MNNPADLFSDLRRRIALSPLLIRRLWQHGLHPDDLHTQEDLDRLPSLVSRADLADHLEELLAIDPGDNPEDLAWVWSSGSSGQPLRIPRTNGDRRWRWGIFHNLGLREGVDLCQLRQAVLLCALPGGAEYEVAAGAGAMLATRRIAVQVPGWQKRLHAMQPEVLFLSAAGLELLLEALLRVPAAPIRPRLIFSTAVLLDETIRRRAEELLGCPVLNVFSMAETGPFAWECRQRPRCFHVVEPEYHVTPGWQFVMDDPAPGPRVTRLGGSLLPLVNYPLPDPCKVTHGICVCGNAGTTLEGLTGRAARDKGKSGGLTGPVM